MDDIPAEMQEVAEQVKQSQRARSVTVRDILSWYGYSRRGAAITSLIKGHMDALEVTVPEFEGAYIDASIKMFTKRQLRDLVAATPSHEQPPEKEEEAASEPRLPSHQISRLKAANTPPLSVSPNDSLQKAVTMMLLHGYSQLPVMVTDRELKGIVSWKTIGERLAAGQSCHEVRTCMKPAKEVRDTDSMFDVIREVSVHDCVLVRGSDRRIMGIVTAADISEQFQTIAEPFLVLEDIENYLRHLIEQAGFNTEELNQVRDPQHAERPIQTPADMSFGDYQRLLDKEDHWKRVAPHLDRVAFIKELDEVRKIRNDVMHFDPDGIDPETLGTIRKFSKFLKRLVALRAN